MYFCIEIIKHLSINQTMGIIIGIDVGTSTTKIVGLREGVVISPTRIRATDPITSLYGAFGKYLYDNHISLSDVEQVMLTGVGSAYVNKPIYGLPTDKAQEFLADGLGARYESKQNRMLVVSMGTGTSFVKVEGNDIRHIGGMGIGGGTLKGLSQLLLSTDDVKHVAQMAEKGDVKNVNLQIGDISATPLPGLPLEATASIFGNVKLTATHEDIAAGLICTVLQTIGSATVLAALGSDRTGETLRCPLHHSQVLRVLHRHRSRSLFQTNEGVDGHSVREG